MRKMLPTTAAVIAMLGVAGLAPVKAQTVFDVPGEAVGGAIGTGAATGPVVYGPRGYVATYGPYDEPYAGPYGYAPARAPMAVQCGIGCRYYGEIYPW